MKRLVFLSLLRFLCGFAQDGFKPSFNGKDLTGWDGNPELWKVENGEIVGNTTGPEQLAYNQFLIWRGGKVKNFELKAKIKQKRQQHRHPVSQQGTAGERQVVHRRLPVRHSSRASEQRDGL
jgi:hypothetical protein